MPNTRNSKILFPIYALFLHTQYTVTHIATSEDSELMLRMRILSIIDLWTFERALRMRMTTAIGPEPMSRHPNAIAIDREIAFCCARTLTGWLSN